MYLLILRKSIEPCTNIILRLVPKASVCLWVHIDAKMWVAKSAHGCPMRVRWVPKVGQASLPNVGANMCPWQPQGYTSVCLQVHTASQCVAKSFHGCMKMSPILHVCVYKYNFHVLADSLLAQVKIMTQIKNLITISLVLPACINWSIIIIAKRWDTVQPKFVPTWY